MSVLFKTFHHVHAKPDSVFGGSCFIKPTSQHRDASKHKPHMTDERSSRNVAWLPETRLAGDRGSSGAHGSVPLAFPPYQGLKMRALKNKRVLFSSIRKWAFKATEQHEGTINLCSRVTAVSLKRLHTTGVQLHDILKKGELQRWKQISDWPALGVGWGTPIGKAWRIFRVGNYLLGHWKAGYMILHIYQNLQHVEHRVNPNIKYGL